MQRGTMVTVGRSPLKRNNRPRRCDTPLGFLVAGLMRGNLSARTVIDRYLDGPLGAKVATAIRFGTLTDGAIGERSRPLHTRAAARMLAAFLIVIENADPSTMRASGTALWQGTIARRLQLSTTKGTNGTLGGIREVQRYMVAFTSAGAWSLDQPDALNVPDRLRGRVKESIVRGQRVKTRWAYNIVRVHGWLSDALRGLLVRFRDRDKPTAEIDHQARAKLDDVIQTATHPAEFLRALVTFLETRPRPT